MSQQFEVDVLKVIFGPTETSFVILATRDKATGEQIVAKGTVYSVSEGGTLSFIGKKVQDKKYGEQLEIISVAPSADMSIKAFLTSGMIPGITPHLGEIMYERWGEETPNVLTNEPAKILSLPRVDEKRQKEIIQGWERLYMSRDAIAFFVSAGVTEAMLKRIERKWKSLSTAYEAVKGNPYILTIAMAAVPFAVSDRIASYMGGQLNSTERMKAAILTVLRKNERNGHCFLWRDDLVNEALALVGSFYDELYEAIAIMHDEETINVFDSGGSLAVYTSKLFSYQYLVGQRIAEFCAERTPVPNDLAERIGVLMFRRPSFQNGMTPETDPEHFFKLDKIQAAAVAMACEWKTSVITGGPGTGKTTVLQSILFALRNPQYCGQEYEKDSILLCAPTGKAAQRMRLSTGWPASTIHRMLGLYGSDDDDMEPVQGAGDISHARVVIVDEASMIDTYLMGALCRALPAACKLIIVGDVDQLPSIGPGNVFKDIIQSQCLPVARLTSVYRQSEGSRIFDNAKAVITGNYDAFALDGEDFEFVNTALVQDETEAPAVLNTVRAALKSGLSPFDFLVLSPMYKGDVGVTALNTRIQEICNPDGFTVYSGRQLIYKEGDKVLQTVNNYDKNVFNGDVGRIITFEEFERRFPYPRDENGREIDADEVLSGQKYTVKEKKAAAIQKARMQNPQTLIDFGEDNIVPYTQPEMQEITLAYAMTVHKAQGSEAHTVIQVASTTQHIMLYRQLFYTAMTRARRKLYIVGTEAAIMRACRNVGNTVRRTHLQYFLQLIRYQDHVAKQKGQIIPAPRAQTTPPTWQLPETDDDDYDERADFARKEQKARKEHFDWGRD